MDFAKLDRLHYTKHMSFEEEENEDRQESPDWKKYFWDYNYRLMRFISKEEPTVFRKSLTNINKQLYLQLSNMARKEESKRLKRIKWWRKSDKASVTQGYVFMFYLISNELVMYCRYDRDNFYSISWLS